MAQFRTILSIRIVEKPRFQILYRDKPSKDMDFDIMKIDSFRQSKLVMPQTQT